MKNNLIFLFLLAILFTACDSNSTKPDDSDLNGLSFKSIILLDSRVTPNKYANFVADATGEDLTYKWSVSQGTIVGNGKQILFTICHPTSIKIKCTIKDKFNHSITKELEFFVTDDIQIDLDNK